MGTGQTPNKVKGLVFLREKQTRLLANFLHKPLFFVLHVCTETIEICDGIIWTMMKFSLPLMVNLTNEQSLTPQLHLQKSKLHTKTIFHISYNGRVMYATCKPRQAEEAFDHAFPTVDSPTGAPVTTTTTSPVEPSSAPQSRDSSHHLSPLRVT